MPKKTSKNSKTLTGSLRRLGRTNLVVLAAFVLTFVGLGTLFVARSEAAGHDCVVRTYSYAPYNYYWCVQQLQRSLTDLSPYLFGVRSPGYADGKFGSATLTSVKSFQNYVKIYPDGIVGPNTWLNICIKLSQNKYNNYSLFNNQMYNDGCNLDGIY